MTLTLDEPPGRWVLLTAVLGSGIALLDTTAVNVALPAIGRNLDAGFAALQWTVSGYTLTLAALLLLGGSLGDRYGRRRLFVVGTCWFAAASLLCSLAPTATLLVAARALQGIGAALLTPASLALLTATFHGPDRGRAIGAWSGLTGVAAAVGPLLGGLLVEASWRLVFLVNLPVAAVAVLLARRHVPESRDPQGGHELDVTGALLAVLGLAGTTYALISAGGSGPILPPAATGAAGLAALVAFVVHERRAAAPMLPPGLFASRQFSGGNLVTLAVYAALGGVTFLLVVQLQVVLGLPALAAGAGLLPITVCMLLLSPRTGALAARIGPRRPMTLGPLVCAAGLLLLRTTGPSSHYLTGVLPAVGVFGLGLATTVAPLTNAVLSAAPDRLAGTASAVNSAVARAAGLLAVAVLPLVAGLSGNDYRQPRVFAHGFSVAMLVAAGLLVGGALLAWTTISDDATVQEAPA